MSDDTWSPSEICVDDACKRIDIHRKHLVMRHEPPRAHHRPDPNKKPLWQRNDPNGLTGAVARATSKSQPKVISEIIRDVRDDYGEVTERSVYRHVKKLVERGHLIKLDLGLTFAAYIRPKSRLLKNPEALKDFVLGEIEFGRGCTGKQRYEEAPGFECDQRAQRAELTAPIETTSLRRKPRDSRMAISRFVARSVDTVEERNGRVSDAYPTLEELHLGLA